jgi:hypothetical protein
MSGNSRRTGKQEATRNLAAALNIPPPQVAGGTIPVTWLRQVVDMISRLGLSPEDSLLASSGVADLSKRNLMRRAVELAGGNWDPRMVTSVGSTITGEAVWYLHDLVAARASGAEYAPAPLFSAEEIDVEHDDDADEFDVSGIQQYLSDLSEDGPIPQGAGPKPAIPPFAPDDVLFENNDWLVRVARLQAWLGLDSPVSLTLAPQELAFQLFEQVSPDPADACVRNEDDLIVLTQLGAQHLETWLSRAVAHREAFQEALDEDKSLREASEEWFLYWQESGSLARQPASIKATVETLKIKHLVDYANQGDLELNPSYQRDSVWSVGDSQLLIDSILRGIPLPSIILTQVEGGNGLQIVDGKQRLTAILRFIGQHPQARNWVRSVGREGAAQTEIKKREAEALAEFDRDQKRFMRKRHLRAREIAEHYLPFRLRRYPQTDPLHAVSGKYYCEVRDTEIPVGQSKQKVSDLFERALSPYQIPVITYENTRLQDIHHVFSIYNKQGKKLNAEELRNATYHHLGLTKLLLVLSGDRPDVEELAPYLVHDVRSDIEEAGETLRDRGFGTLRFRRTKVLSWTCAIFLHAPNKSRDGYFVTPSTASHIDALLWEISEKQGSHRLFHNTTLTTLARDVKAAVALHVDVDDAWSPRFRSKKGHASRWEELPLVGSLVACLVLAATDQAERLRMHVGEVRAFTEASPGPSKTQNKTQWEYIARVALGVLRTVGLEQTEAGARLEQRYGYNCLDVLGALAQSTAE